MAEPTTPGVSDPDRANPWTRTPTLLAIGFVALILVLGAAVVLNTRDNGTPGAAPGGSSSPATPPRATGPADEHLDTTVPTSPPAGVHWQIYNTVALPYSPTAGPRTVTGDVARGYAHTPTGALIAATQIPARQTTSNDWRSVMDAGIAPGPGRDAWITARSKIGKFDPITPGTLGQTAGFKFVDYTPDRAVIQFVTRFASGDLQLTVSTVAWDGNDWRLVLQPDGGQSPTVQHVPSLAGFIPWGGI